MKNFDVEVFLDENLIYIIPCDEDFDDFNIDIDKYWDFIKNKGLDYYEVSIYQPKYEEKYTTGDAYYYNFSDYIEKPILEFKEDLKMYFKENIISF